MSEQPADEPGGRRSRLDVHVDKHLMAHVSGDLDVSTAPRLAVELDRLAADGGTICVDLANLEFCGAAGINVLVGAVRTLGTRGRLVIYDPSPMVARVIDITGLDHLVDVVVGRVIAAPHPAGVGRHWAWAGSADPSPPTQSDRSQVRQRPSPGRSSSPVDAEVR